MGVSQEYSLVSLVSTLCLSSYCDRSIERTSLHVIVVTMAKLLCLLLLCVAAPLAAAKTEKDVTSLQIGVKVALAACRCCL